MLRLLGLFEAIAKAPEGLSLAELSMALETPKSSLLALLKPLVAAGHLVHAEQRYRPGPAMFQMAETILRARQPSVLLRAFMQELWTETRETVLLTAIDRNARVVTYVECLDSPQLIRYVVSVGAVRPLYVSAAGQTLLAFQPEAWQEAYLRTAKLQRMTGETITDRVALRRRLAEIRRSGMGVSIGEAVQGAAGIAAPIIQADGTVNEALLLAGPAERIERNKDALSTLVRDISERMSAALGYRGLADINANRRATARI